MKVLDICTGNNIVSITVNVYKMTLKFNSQQEIAAFIRANAHDVKKMNELAAYFQSHNSSKNDAGLASSANEKVILKNVAEPGSPQIAHPLFEDHELVQYFSCDPDPESQMDEVDYFDPLFWEVIVERVIKQNKGLQKIPHNRILVAQMLSNIMHVLTGDIDDSIKNKILKQIIDPDCNNISRTYSVKETEEMTGLSVGIIIKHLNDGFYFGQKINGEWRLTALDISYIYYLADLFLKEHHKRKRK